MTHKFHSGPPPHAGWWRAKEEDDCNGADWRFWNGIHWSPSLADTLTGRCADARTNRRILLSNRKTQWSNYWPPSALPRINPDTGEVIGGAV